jgi:hypothetical protein
MTTKSRWPVHEKDEHGYIDEDYIPVEMGWEEIGIVETFAERMGPDDPISARFDDQTFVITFRDKDYLVPLSFSTHDVHITVSSISEIIGDDYSVFVDRHTVGETFNNLVVAAHSTMADRGPLPDHLIPLQPGFDYFTGDPSAGAALAIPYVGHEAPGFAAGMAEHADKVESSKALVDVLLRGMFTGKIDETKLQAAAAGMAKIPEVKAELGARSETEVADELRKSMQEAFADKEMSSHLSGLRKGMDELRAMTGNPPLLPPPKPWWKFW